MSQGKDVTARVQALDGVWETLGVDRARGVWPENVSLSADRWGSSSASMDLRRDPGAAWPDIGAFTPIEVEVGGVKVWSGRVKETPARDGSDRVLSLQCEGWQFHLDDDQYERSYVRTRLSDWKDGRQYLTTDLTARTQAWNVQSGDGAIIIGFPTGSTVGANTSGSVILDLGPSSGAKRVVFTASGGAWSGGSVRLRGSDGPTPTSYAEDLVVAATLPGATSTTYAQTFASPRRFVEIMVSNGPASAGGSDAITFLRITDVKVFADTAYESGNTSVLKAPQVINDALDRATVLLSSDRSQVASTSFNLPELAFDDPRTTRQVIDGVNAYHNYTTAVDVDRRPVFRPQESAPRWEVGAWSGMEFEDASANSGEDIYNRVLVTGQTPAGEPLRVERYTADTNRGGNPYIWDRLTPISAASTYTSSGSPTRFVPRVYSVSFTYSVASGTAPLRVRFGDTAGTDFVEVNVTATTTPQTVWLTWIPKAVVTTAAYAQVKNNAPLGGPVAQADMTAHTSAATLVDRRAARRTMTLPISSALPSDGAAAAQIADIWLAAHKTTPFRGSVTLTGEALRDVLTGDSVPLERLLLAPQVLIRFSDRIDPDTGAHGRDGRIASVTYTPASDGAQVTIDSSRANFETLLSRLAVIGGG